MIYFDNAATTGVKPQGVIKAVEKALVNYSANPGRSGHFAASKTAEEIFKIREKVADFFGASGPERVCFTMNCTHSINTVLKGVLKKGDHVIVSSLEHNAVMRPLTKIGISFDVAEVSLTDDNSTVKAFKNKIKPNTRLIFCTGASNVLGKILPIKEIGELCFQKGILFAVDAAQTAGVLPVNMKEMHIDYLCVAAHKGLYAPEGIGILICEKGIENTLIEGGTGTNSLEMYQPKNLPERIESGTINVPGIFGVSAGIDYVKKIGVDNIYKGELNLINELYRGLIKNPNIIFYTPDPNSFSYAPLLSFNYRGYESDKTAKILSENGFATRGGLHCAPSAHRQIGTHKSGTVRVSVASFNNIKEIHQLIDFFNKKM